MGVLTLRVDAAKIHSKVRRSALSLPSGSSLSVTMDLIIPVVPLINTTLTYLWFDLPLTFDLPTASTLNELYVSLGLLSKASNDDDDSDTSNELSHDFVEDQRANHDRRQVYQYAESFFQKWFFFFVTSDDIKIFGKSILKTFDILKQLWTQRTSLREASHLRAGWSAIRQPRSVWQNFRAFISVSKNLILNSSLHV